jgi:hypothetical protein
MRPITQLTENEYEELRDSYYYELLDNGMMINYPSDITSEMMEKHYGGISFVDEDFFCNLKD